NHQNRKKRKETKGNNKKNQTKEDTNQQKSSKKSTPEKIVYQGTLTVGELADKLNKDSSEIIKKLLFLGVMATKNQDLDDDAIELICSEYDVKVEKEIILEDTDFNKYIAEE